MAAATGASASRKIAAAAAAETILQSPPDSKTDIHVVTRPNNANELASTDSAPRLRSLAAAACWVQDICPTGVTIIFLPPSKHSLRALVHL